MMPSVASMLRPTPVASLLLPLLCVLLSVMGLEGGLINYGSIGDENSVTLFEGDIILPSLGYLGLRKAMTTDLRLWPRRGGVPTIRYRFGSSGMDKSGTLAAIAHYEEHTCLRFKEVTSPLTVGPHIVFSKSNRVCSSTIGMSRFSFLGQKIRLSRYCATSLVIVAHEIGHAIGLYHEQSRLDRDRYVKILYSNMKLPTILNFSKALTRHFNTIYDYYSIMQYGPMAFTWNGRTTIAAKDPYAQGLLILPRSGFSFMDKRIINELYKCTDYWQKQCGMDTNPCENLGYVGENCNCVCPPGTSRSKCQRLDKPYTEALMDELLPLNEEVTSSGIIKSPDYPQPKLDAVAFVKVIRAPECKRVLLTVKQFDLNQKCSPIHCCREGLEIKSKHMLVGGRWHCGNSLKAGDTILSKGNTMILFYFRAQLLVNTSKGFKVDITFEPINGCTP